VEIVGARFIAPGPHPPLRGDLSRGRGEDRAKFAKPEFLRLTASSHSELLQPGPAAEKKNQNLFGPHVAGDAGESFAALDDDALESFRDRAVARDAAAGSERSLKEKMFALMTPA